ncbi:MAG: GNAT family N-acetyltransferase [Bacteroidota bacterium]|nr:GNAT family N-acetyltransferase [Bacteroidota bacterium]
METIIPPVDCVLLEKELNEDRFIRKTNNGNNDIFIVTHHDSPHVMREIGRLREITFRFAGGGTGKAVDIDMFDTAKIPFRQLIVWDPEAKEIIGGYRYIHCNELEVDTDGTIKTPTARLFKYSKKFIKEYIPYTLELGRSFVQPIYMPTINIRRGMYSLDNIWDGLGAIVIDNPDVKYLFGKVTLYPHFDILAKECIYYFIEKYFPDKENLVVPHIPVKLGTSKKILDNVFAGCNYDENYRILVAKVRGFKENIPPLFNAYMNLSSTMKTFGAALNTHFGNVEETGIIVTIADIFDYKKDRHLSTYKK